MASQRPDAPFSALEQSLEGLARDFRLYAWVKRVSRVERTAPNRLVVRLEYRQPVALASFGDAPPPLLIDEEGVILPIDDIDDEARKSLIHLLNLPPPLERRVGKVWLSGESRRGIEVGAPDPRVPAAGRLAAFLLAARRSESRPVPLALWPIAIYWDSGSKTAFFVENGEKSLLYWREPPGSESPGQLTARDRWERLRDWVKNHSETTVKYPFYLDFKASGVVLGRGREGS